MKADIDEDNIITSDNFTYSIDTITDNLQIPWGLTFLPNNDLLVTERSGGRGAVREVAEMILRAQESYQSVFRRLSGETG